MTLEDRLARLEADRDDLAIQLTRLHHRHRCFMKWLASALLMAVVLLTVPFLLGAQRAGTTQELVNTKNVMIVDEEGNRRGIWNERGLLFIDKKGQLRMAVTGGALYVNDSQGDPQVIVDEKGLQIAGKQGKTMTAVGKDGLLLFDPDGKRRAMFSADADGAHLELMTKDQDVRFTLQEKALGFADDSGTRSSMFDNDGLAFRVGSSIGKQHIVIKLGSTGPVVHAAEKTGREVPLSR